MEIEEERPARSKLRLTAIIIALYLALFIAALDQMITATSIPTISTQLHSAAGYSWIGGAYLLAAAAGGPLWAKCSDIWGRKPCFLAAVALFFVANIIAAVSTSMPMLITARALQGTAGGGLVQLVYITVSDLFSPRRRAVILGSLETIWALAGGVGPLLGGAFTQLVSWRWIFWINVPVAGLAFLLLLFFLDVHNPRTKLSDGVKAIDWFGTVSILGVCIMILLGLDFGGVVFPWNSATVICLIVFGSVLIGFFLFSERRLARYPLMPLDIFKTWRSGAIFIVGFAHGVVFIAGEYYMPLYFQSVKQASPLRSGVLILPITLWETLTGFVSGFVIEKTGRYRELVWGGMVLLTIGTGLYILLGPDSSLGMIVGFQMIAGSGAGFLFQSPLIAVQGAVSQADTAMATATFGFVRTTAMALSLVIGGVVFQNSIDQHLPRLEAAGVPQRVLDALGGGQAAAHVDIVQTVSDVTQQDLITSSFAAGLRNMWIMYTAIAGVGVVASLFITQVYLRLDHTETRTGIANMREKEREREQL